MSTIDELLDEQLEVEDDPICTIDKVTRKINMHEACKFFGVEHDKKVERIKFECPKEVGDENVDLTTCQVLIAYENANGEPGLYEIEDLTDDGDVVRFSWLFDEDVTMYKGDVKFIFYACKPNGDEREVAWNTVPAQGFVEEGLDVIGRVEERSPAIIESMLRRIAVLEDIKVPDITILLDTTLKEEGKAADAKAVGDALAKINNGGGGTGEGGSSPYNIPCVMDYGAKGDGIADDTTAFQTALEENRIVYVPGGTYNLSAGLVIGDNCCMELSQDTVLNFTQTTVNCVTLGMSSSLKGNHATVKVPYAFGGHVLHAYSNDHTDMDIQAVPPWSKWDPQWKSGRYVSDLNICKEDSRGFHYAVNPDECKGTAVYISADHTTGLSTFMWGVYYSGLRIAGAFVYGIHAQNFDNGWLHEMRIDAFIDACETGVCLEDCNDTYISAIIQPRRAYTEAKEYVPYAKNGIKLVRSKNTDLSGSRVWDWNGTHTLWTQHNEYQHIAMYGDCSGTILNDFSYHSQGDTRKRIYTDNEYNLETVTILQEPVNRWFKLIDGEPYYSDGVANHRLLDEEALDTLLTVDWVKDFDDVLETATDENGDVFNDIGYQVGKRFTSMATGTTLTDSVYYMVTGFIKVPLGSTIYGKSLHFDDVNKTYAGIVYYNDKRERVANMGIGNVVSGSQYYANNYTRTSDGFSVQIPASVTLTNLNATYIRMVFPMTCVGENPMLSIDEPIKYTVEGFLADGVKVKGENVIGTPGQTTPDWVATKKLEGGNVVYIPEQTVSSSMWNNLQVAFQPGMLYDVYINGTLYTREADANGSQGVLLGNSASMSLNDDPFCIMWAGGTATSGMFFKDSSISSPVTLKVTDHAYYVYDKMPEDYLPDGVVKSVNGTKPDFYGNVEVESGGGGVDVSASVGQTIVVKEVDANGKPTKWEAADYQPRTHWSEETVVLEETTIIPNEEGELMFTPLAVPSVGDICKVTYNGTEYECKAIDVSALTGVECVYLGNAEVLGDANTDEPFGVMLFTAGGGGAMLLPLDEAETFTLSISGEVVIKIPEKYIPSASNEFAIHFTGYPKENPEAGEEMQVLERPEAIYEALSSGKKIVGHLNCTYNGRNISCVMHDYTIDTPSNGENDSYNVTFGVWHAFFIPDVHKIRLAVGYLDGNLVMLLEASSYDLST